MGTTDKAKIPPDQTKLELEAAGAISGIAERRRKVADQKKADIKQVGEKLMEAFKK